MTHTRSLFQRKTHLLILICVVLSLWCPIGAAGQSRTADPNQGALTFTAGIDLSSLYYFRGIRQEGEPKLTFWPSADATAALRSGGGTRVAATVGIWNSLHTGTSGTGGPERKLQYEQDFSAGVKLEFVRRVRVDSFYVAYTSPNRSFETIKEADVRVAETGRWAPYGLVAFELSDAGQRDMGSRKGTYLELGAGPRWLLPVRDLVLTVPVKAGFSLGQYYELLGSDFRFHDSRFGFVEAGGLLTLPLTQSATRFGTWQVHGGVDALRLGTTAQALNKGKRTGVVAVVGIGVLY